MPNWLLFIIGLIAVLFFAIQDVKHALSQRRPVAGGTHERATARDYGTSEVSLRDVKKFLSHLRRSSTPDAFLNVTAKGPLDEYIGIIWVDDRFVASRPLYTEQGRSSEPQIKRVCKEMGLRTEETSGEREPSNRFLDIELEGTDERVSHLLSQLFVQGLGVRSDASVTVEWSGFHLRH